MSSAISIINSEHPIPSDIYVPCFTCKTARSEFFWPTASKEPCGYCKPCLEEAKQILCIALGLASSR